MALSNAEVDAFNAALGELRHVTDSVVAEEALQGLAAQLRAYERRAQVTSSLSAYDRRAAGLRLDRLAYNLAAARKLVVPRRAFAFSSRRYLGGGTAPAPADGPVVRAGENVASGLKDVCFRLAEEAPGDYALRRCTGARIVLPTQLAALYVDDCIDCAIFCSSVTGAVHVERCRGLVLVAACHQLRVHDTTASVFVVAAGSPPIIERCNDLQFVPLRRMTVEAHAGLFARLDPRLRGRLLESGLDPALDGDLPAVRDFSWLRAGENPHYRTCPDATLLTPEGLLEDVLRALVEASPTEEHQSSM